MAFPTVSLLKSSLYTQNITYMTEDERTSLSYHRARAIAKAYDFHVEDVLYPTPKFWQLHRDLIHTQDGAGLTLLSIQYNLMAGTLAPHTLKQSDHRELLEKVLRFDVSAQFMLTEVGHGLDARNIETTATLLPDGSFDLHTPNRGAAKIMPPAWPIADFPKVALVFAQLIVSGESRGLRPFVVWLNDGKRMSEGVTAKLLPTRAASRPLDHSITMFNHVRLPGNALLGEMSKPSNLRIDFLQQTFRISVGSLALSSTMIGSMKVAAFVAGRYSLRRRVQSGPDGTTVPIISFRTQQHPILHTLAQVSVFDAYAAEITDMFQHVSQPPLVLHGLGTTFKAVICHAFRNGMRSLGERCGAQGLYLHNHIVQLEVESRGVIIAEGDSLVLCIRLATELLLNRYQLPAPRDPTCLLARHEKGLFDECREILSNIPEGHRSPEFNSLILPRCEALVQAIGHRMAYEAAVKAGVSADLLALYEAGVVLLDVGWYIEHANYSRQDQLFAEAKALDNVLPRLEELIEGTGYEPYCTAPVLSQGSWDGFVDSLDEREGPKPAGPLVSVPGLIRSLLASFLPARIFGPEKMKDY